MDKNPKTAKTNWVPAVGKPYSFRKEFCPSLGITDYQVTKRKQDLLTWLTNFYNYEFIEAPGQMLVIVVKEVIGDYQPMPRKAPKQDALNAEKQKDYDTYTIAALGPEYKPNSQAKVARGAIASFGNSKYGHRNPKWVANTYISKSFKQYGESNNNYLWVWYYDYIPLTGQEVEHWREILREEKIDEQEAANAFYKHAQGEDITKELSAYQKALERIKEETCGNFPVRVKEWRLKMRQAQ